jgi:mannosyltransferase
MEARRGFLARRRRLRPKGAGLRTLADGWHTWAAACAVAALAAILRVPTVGLQGYDFDEGGTLYVIGGSFMQMVHGIGRYESTPPLYYVLAWAWAHPFGTGEAGLRLLSAMTGAATVVLVYAAGRTLGSARVGLVAAAVVATSPYLVFYSQEARSYSLYAFIATAGFLCCVRAIDNPRARTLGLWAAISILAIATHYFAFFLWVGQAVVLAVFGAPRRLLAWSIAAVALASLPLLVLAKHQAAAGHASWIGSAPLTQRLRVMAETFTLGATFKGTLPHSILIICGLCAIVIGWGIFSAFALLIRRAAPDERRAAKISGLTAAVAFALPLIGALGPWDYLVHKNLIPLVPLGAVVLAAGLGSRRAGRLGMAGAIALVLAGLTLTVMSFAVPSMRRPDVRLVSRQLGPPARERVLVFIPRWRVLIEHYQGKLEDLPPTGRRVREVDVFTASESIPAGTVPQGFRLEREQHGNPFRVFSYRSRVPLTMTPGRLAHRTFSESGLQPVAVVQGRR